jgi:hypothetical protein
VPCTHRTTGKCSLPPAELEPLEAGLRSLEATPLQTNPLLAAAIRGAGSWSRDLLERMAELELSVPLEELKAGDSQEWWQVEQALKERDMQLAIVKALIGEANLARVSADSDSPVYAAHRRAVEEAIGHAVPHLALVEVALTLPLGETINGWLPPYEEIPWAIALTRPVETDGRFDRTLLHELVHAAQAQFLYPVLDDKELEWVLGVGNRTLIEGATETLIEQIAGAPCSEFYLVETSTLIRLATRLQMTPLELARRVSASSYPLDVVADLWGSDDEQLAWEILIVNDEERERK